MPSSISFNLDPSMYAAAAYGAGQATARRENVITSLQARQKAAMQQADIFAQQQNQQFAAAHQEAMEANRLQAYRVDAENDRQNRVNLALLGYTLDTAKSKDQFAQQFALDRWNKNEAQKQADHNALLNAHLDFVNWADKNAPNVAKSLAPMTPPHADSAPPVVRQPDWHIPDPLDGGIQNHIRAEDAARIAMTPFTKQRDELLAAAAKGEPGAIQQAVSLGYYKYSQDQTQEMSKIQAARSKIDRDPRMSPLERLTAHRQLAAQYKAIADNPVPVPSHEQPKSMAELVNEKIVRYYNPLTGRDHLVKLNAKGEPEEMFEQHEFKDDSPQRELDRMKHFDSRFDSAVKLLTTYDEAGSPSYPDTKDVLEYLQAKDSAYAALGGDAQKAGRPQTLPQVKTAAEAMRLPPGTQFLDPNGIKRIRP